MWLEEGEKYCSLFIVWPAHWYNKKYTNELKVAARPVGYTVLHSRYIKQLKAVVCICHVQRRTRG